MIAAPDATASSTAPASKCWRFPSLGARFPRFPARPPRLPAQLPRLPARLPRLPAQLPRLPARLPRFPAQRDSPEPDTGWGARSAALSDRPRSAAHPWWSSAGMTASEMTANTPRDSGPRINSEVHDGVALSPGIRPSTRTTTTMPSTPSIGSATDRTSAPGRKDAWRTIHRPVVRAMAQPTSAWSRATTVMPRWTVQIRTAVRTARCSPRPRKTRSARPTALRTWRALRVKDRKSPYKARNRTAGAAGADLPPSREMSPANSTRPANHGMLSALMRPKVLCAALAMASREGNLQKRKRPRRSPRPRSTGRAEADPVCEGVEAKCHRTKNMAHDDVVDVEEA